MGQAATKEPTDDLAGAVKCRPFLKWAGGKAELLAELIKRVPPTYGTYVEPFVGAGALLFGLQPQQAVIRDINEELINCYMMVRDQIEGLISSLTRHRYERGYYYAIRDSDRAADFFGLTPLQRASRFIFLNKTCFNGLYRVNAKGEFNVPMGRYSNPKILDAVNLRACSSVLQRVKIESGGFLDIEEALSANDFVYFDPPYVPLSQTSSFTSYSAEGFGPDDQRALYELCCRLDKRGVHFMLSNSSAESVVEQYKEFRVESLPVSRAINAKATKRGPVAELIIRNY